MTEYKQSPTPETELEAALAQCASEPIRVPGAIQPHGVLLALCGNPLRVEQVSSNCAYELGLYPNELLGKPLSFLVSPEQALLISRAQPRPNGMADEPLRLSIWGNDYNASIHTCEEMLIIELEPYAAPMPDQSRIITRVLRNLQASTDLETLFDISVHEIQALTGFDRVMIYRFEPEGHGKVVAEALTGSLPSYIGLNFPASDIPAQARELYRLNWIRLIPDAAYTPVPLVPLLRPSTGRPLDLGFSTLRSVSPVHCEYLRNMGVQSSMSISLIDEGELWGLIACCHPKPFLVPTEIRGVCALIGQLLSAKIVGIVNAQSQREREARLAMLSELALAMSRADSEILEGLLNHPEYLLAVTGAHGCAVLVEGRLHLIGRCPTEAQLGALHLWIREVGLPRQKLQRSNSGTQGLGIFHTDALLKENSDGADYSEIASGIIALILPKPIASAVMWFRPQLTSTMNWSGNPDQHLNPSGPGSPSHRLHPRQSFDIWQEQVTGSAKPWSKADLYAAEDIRRSALEHDLERQVLREHEAVRLRDDLVAVVSHDLRNPMSIIIMQCGMMQRWAGSETFTENRQIRKALGTIEKATSRMSTLLEDLLDTAKIEAGRYQLSCVGLDVTSLLEEAGNLLVTLTAAKNIEINCVADRDLVINADPERFFQVLSNLIGNAIKFTPSRGQITISATRKGTDIVITVRDNGIGIAPDHLPLIFQRYWSVKEGNPNGNGLGLYITQGIINAHGGHISATSEPGLGSVFTFSIPEYRGPRIADDKAFLNRVS